MTETKAVVAVEAHSNFERTIELKSEIARNFLTLGALLWECLDKEYWKVLGHDSFEAYVATPEIALSRSYAYQVVRLYDIYCGSLGVEQDTLLRIGPSRLIALLPAASMTDKEEDIEILMSDAEHLSLSDLAEKYGKGKNGGKGNGKSYDKTASPKKRAGDFDKWKLESGCVVCGEEAERAHLPHSKGAGGTYWIPLCREHHAEQHQNGAETFAGKYWKDVMMWFHYRLEEAWERGNE